MSIKAKKINSNKFIKQVHPLFNLHTKQQKSFITKPMNNLLYQLKYGSIRTHDVVARA